MQHSPSSSAILPGAEPFSLPGNGQVGCLLVHGFSSTPYDVRACGDYLSAHGITADGVLLAGHGTRPEDLAATTLDNWLQSIRDAHAQLRQHCPVVFALGISFAGNLLVLLADELRLDGLITIGMPLQLKYQRTLRTVSSVLRLFGKQYKKKWYQQSLDPAIKKLRPNYDRLPLKCGADVMRGIRQSAQTLHTVRCPVLAIQSTTDHALAEDTMDAIAAGVGTTDVQTRWVHNRYHVVIIDYGKEDVFADILQFIQQRAEARQ